MTFDVKNYGKGYELVTDEEVDENTIIPDDSWALKLNDTIVGINVISFNQEPNPDGTFGVTIDYNILEGKPLPDMDNVVGQAVMKVLEDAFAMKDYKEKTKK